MPRPKGSKNKRTIMAKANADNWLKAGQISPLDHILGVQHGTIPGPHDSDEAADQYRAAVDAAPYVHAKLTSAKIDADVNANINVVELDKSGGRGD